MLLQICWGKFKLHNETQMIKKMKKGVLSMRKKLKRTFTSFVAVIILVTTLLSGAMFTVTAEGVRTSYNLYLIPNLSSVKGNIRTYSICFRSNTAQPAPGTFWALSNFGFTGQDQGKQTTGGYAGFQVYDRYHNNQPAAILSMFQKDPTKTDGTCATYMYPNNTSKGLGAIGNEEPACFNTNKPFDWEGQTWYRMVLHCWNDNDNGTTFIGMWIQNMKTREWKLFSYYDTKLRNAAMRGDMGFFQENFAPQEFTTRQYDIKGIYAKDTYDNMWKSVNSARQSYSGSYARGNPSFGVAKDENGEQYFTGSVGTGKLASNKDPMYDYTVNSITQSSSPSFGSTLWLKDFNCKKDSSNSKKNEY